jgi:pyruvate dehydrogenase E2 component (dihydrolipoamide acetyltransferase)
LCSIETDKATMDYEMQDEGYLARTFFPEGTKDIPLGVALAILTETPEDIPAFDNYTDGGAAAAESTPAAAEATPVAVTPAASTPAAS